jgi:PhnB protein
MQIQPYLFYEGRCEEAMEFYRGAVGAEVTMMMRYKDSPEKNPEMCPPGNENNVMHASFRVGGSTILASDGMGSGKPKFEGIALSLTVATDVEAKRTFDALSAGGAVQMPLTKTFFSSSFGMAVDRFGVSWMIYVAP